MVANMKLYAIYKNDVLYRASYKQNTPFYETLKGAEAAVKSLTNRRCLPYDMYLNKERRFTEREIQKFLDKEKAKYKIMEFTLSDGRCVK